LVHYAILRIVASYEFKQLPSLLSKILVYFVDVVVPFQYIFTIDINYRPSLYTSDFQPIVHVPLVVREGLSGGTRVDYFLKVNFLFSVCNILFQLVQHSLTLSLLYVIISGSAFRVYCRARYLINS